MSDINKRFSDNLYEPVNPPPLYESGSTVLPGKDNAETGSLDGRRFGFDIPPEIEIVNSEGLDGLDLPDPHDDHGFDGDREWAHSDDEQVVPHKMSFCAGYRGLENAKTSDSESHRSSIRPLTNKTITFDPATKEEVEEVAGSSRRDVSRGRSRSRSRSRSPNPKEGASKKTTPFELLRTKAAGAADQMKQRFSKITLPIRPKLNQWEGAKLSRKKHKKKAAAISQEGEEEGAVAAEEEEEQAEIEENLEPMDTAEQEFPFLPEEPTEPQAVEQPKNKEDQKKEKEAKAEEQRKEKEAAAEEKKRKQKEQDEEKKQKAEEKKKEQEELKKKKAEEKQLAKEESDKKKAEEKAAKQKIQEEAKKVKLEEQLAKARETEEIERQKNEELLKLREHEAAEKASTLSNFETQPETQLAEEETLEEEQQEQEQQTPTPTGTGSRRKKIKKTFVQLPQLPKMPDLPQLPHFDLDFKRKVIKRSKTPPGRPTPPKMKFKRDASGVGSAMEETENQLAAQYASEIEARKLAMEEDNEEHDEATEMVRHIRFPEPPIFVTQPSNEPSEESESHKDWKSFPSSSGRSEEEPEEAVSGKSQVGTKERLDKFGQQLKGFGLKSKEIASKKSKSMGATMKVIGHDLQKLGVKTSEKFQATIEEIKAKQDAAKARTKEKAKEAEDIVHEQSIEPVQYESATEPRRKFRFRRRDESQEEPEQEAGKKPEQYKNTQDLRQSGGEGNTEGGEEEKITRSQLLGRAERDWESPLDLAHSRDVSEEPFSGNASSRDSPPGSSLASSTFAHVRKQGVLEEIDSDEFFLREKGISEGEDGEEINRFLVEELRQAFRLQENALAGFDLDDPPEKPDRQPRKPPRKDKEQEKAYQTFPPERPRRKAPGYVSDYLKENDEEMEEDQCSTQEERGSFQEDLEQFEDDGIRRVKEELGKIENEEENEENIHQDYVDDGRYEPISEEPIEPVKPQRRKKQKSTPLYYNTVSGNEWMREVEDQVMGHEEEALQVPRRATSKSGSIPPENDENEITFVDEDSSNSRQSGAAQVGGGSTNRVDVIDDGDENFEYVDEAGYAVVHKGHQEVPRTVPRRHRKSGNGSKSNSLKRQQQGGQGSSSNGEAQFFSLPRPATRTFHIVPPSRPQRNYSTLKPRRPPRHTSNHSLTKSKGDTSRPSTAIGIMHGMHGRPLPPPPRPERPQILNDLDHTSIERSVGARHYANFVDDSGPRDVEEIIVARNVSLLGRGDLGVDINIGIQTDPLQDYENEAHAAVTSFDDITRRVRQLSDSRNAAGGETERPRTPRPPSSAGRDNPSRESPFNFPRRLHLEELEVDVLRVNDLSANTIRVEHLVAPQLEVNSLTCIGSLSVASIHTQTLNADQINCNRLSSDTVDLPTIVPSSFYNLASRPPPSTQTSQEKPEELRYQPDKYDADNEVICPYAPFGENESQKGDLSFERSSVASPTEEFLMRNVEFCLTPEQSMDNDDSWGHKDNEKLEQTETTSPTPLDEDIAHCSELPQDSGELSGELSSLSRDAVISPRPTGFKPAFKIAVLENRDSSEERSVKLEVLEKEFAGSEAPVVSGSLRLEYSRSPDIPTDLQVLHDMHVETENIRPLSTQRGFQRRNIVELEPELELVSEIQSRVRSSSSGESRLSSSSRGTSLQRSRDSESVENFPEVSVATATQKSPERDENMLRMTMRFGRILSRITMRGLQAIIDYIDVATTDDPAKAEEQRAHMQVLLCLLLILITGIILSSSTGDYYFTPPKWEFFMPPPNL